MLGNETEVGKMLGVDSLLLVSAPDELLMPHDCYQLSSKRAGGLNASDTRRVGRRV